MYKWKKKKRNFWKEDIPKRKWLVETPSIGKQFVSSTSQKINEGPRLRGRKTYSLGVQQKISIWVRPGKKKKKAHLDYLSLQPLSIPSCVCYLRYLWYWKPKLPFSNLPQYHSSLSQTRCITLPNRLSCISLSLSKRLTSSKRLSHSRFKSLRLESRSSGVRESKAGLIVVCTKTTDFRKSWSKAA